MYKLYEEKDKNVYYLPVCYPPPITAYLPISIVSNILTANRGNINWIMHNFIQLIIYETGINRYKLESFPTQKSMYLDQSSMESIEMNGRYLDCDRINIIEDIINWLNEKYYVVVYLDESKLLGMGNYNKKPMLHSQFIFGYDLEQKLFKCMNFSSITFKIEVINITFEDLLRSFKDKETKKLYTATDSIGKEYCIILMKPKTKKADYYMEDTLDKEFIIQQIRQYYNSVNTSFFTMYFSGCMIGTWGQDIYKVIIDIMKSPKHKMDIRMMYLLYEHKVYMKYRLQYFDQAISEEYSKIIHTANILKNVSLKYLLTGKSTLLDKIVCILEQLWDDERKILKIFLEKIDKGIQNRENLENR